MSVPDDSSIEHDARTLAGPAPPTLATHVEVPLPSPQPQRIGRYPITRVIASGGMGTVYEAMQENPRRTVAVKVIKHGIASASTLRRFEYESQILARLRHPGIAQVFEAGMHDDGQGGVPYFAMEYIAEARDITDYADAEELTTRQRLELFINVCEAVHHGHQKGVIHRDLKPANILVDSTGQPKIIDFGVARATDSDLAVTTLQTNVGQLVGTLQYMSPEQINADPHDIDTRSDVYALGVLLYEMLAGSPPYDVTGTVIYEATRIIREEQPKRISTIDKSLKGDVETIVLHALEKDRDRRYQSAIELAQDIRRYLDTRTILARPPSMVYQCRVFVRRNRLLVGSIAAVFVALVLGVVLFSWQAQVAAQQRDIAQDRFGQVRKLAKTFMFDFHDLIQELDGALPARELLVTTALTYLDDLAGQAGSDVELTLELAAAYDRVGDIRGGTRNPSLGDTAGALESYRTALELRRAGAEADPEDLDRTIEVAKSHQRIGDMLEETGDVSGALEEYRLWLSLNEQVAAADPKSLRQRTVALAHNAMGGALVRVGKSTEARRHYEQSLVIRRRLLTSELLPQRDLSVGLFSLGNLLHDTGDYAGALVYHREGFQIRETLARRAPDRGRYKRDLAIAHLFVGRAYLGLGDAARAMEHLGAFLASARERANANPQDARAKRDLASAHGFVGQVYAATHDPARARSSYERFQEIIVPLSESNPEKTNYRELVAESHRRLGELATAEGNPVEAVGHHRRALVIIDSLAAADPDNFPIKINRAELLVRLGGALIGADEPGEARQRLESARSLYERLRENQPENSLLATGLAEVHGALRRLAS